MLYLPSPQRVHDNIGIDVPILYGKYSVTSPCGDGGGGFQFSEKYVT